MNIEIRQETSDDFDEVASVIERAFRNEPFSDHSEPQLVDRLRRSSSFVPELSLVALRDGKIVGHILLTKIKIKSKETFFDSLALAPIAVVPELQGLGIGTKMILEAHQVAGALGFKSVILLGHPQYYPKFGYLPADRFGIELPFDVPLENCMAIELVENGLNGVNGMVVYPKELEG